MNCVGEAAPNGSDVGPVQAVDSDSSLLAVDQHVHFRDADVVECPAAATGGKIQRRSNTRSLEDAERRQLIRGLHGDGECSGHRLSGRIRKLYYKNTGTRRDWRA